MNKGLKIEAADDSHPSLLHEVASLDLSDENIRAIFKWLVVTHGANVNALWKEETPFGKVVALGDKELYDFCLENGAKEALPKLIGKAIESKTPGGEEIVKDLVSKRGADLNGSGPDNYLTPFSVIAGFGSFDMVTWCLDQGASISPDNPSFKILPLQSVAVRDDENAAKIFKLLVSSGGQLNQRGFNQSFPIMPWFRKGNLELVKYCFDNGAKLESKDLVERALQLASQAETPEVVTELQHRGYDMTMSEWDTDQAAKFLVAAYTSGGVAMLEKVIGFATTAESLAEASNELW